MTAAADPGTGAPTNGHGGTVLAFMNEVAGGRKLLEAVRERVAAGVDEVAVAAPQNLPDRRADRRSRRGARGRT